MTIAPWPNLIARQSATLDKLSSALRARLNREISADELDSVIARCGADADAIERDTKLAWQMQCQTRLAVKRGVATWVSS